MTLRLIEPCNGELRVQRHETLTSGQIARLLGISARTARRYILLGKIPAERNPITGRWKVTRAALHGFLAERGLEPPVAVAESDHLH